MSKEKLTKGKTSIISNQKGFKMPVGDMRN